LQSQALLVADDLMRKRCSATLGPSALQDG
jgi:hypothetical protein